MLGLSRVLASSATLRTADTNTNTDQLIQILINHYDVCHTKSLKSHSLQLLATSVCYSTSTQAFQNHTIAQNLLFISPFSLLSHSTKFLHSSEDCCHGKFQTQWEILDGLKQLRDPVPLCLTAQNQYISLVCTSVPSKGLVREIDWLGVDL